MSRRARAASTERVTGKVEIDEARRVVAERTRAERAGAVCERVDAATAEHADAISVGDEGAADATCASTAEREGLAAPERRRNSCRSIATRFL